MNKSDFNLASEEKILKFLDTEVGFENYQNAIDRGLERLRPIFKSLIEKINSKVITIGGTNGKGQTAHHLAAILKSKGHSYCLWTSPHVVTIRERFHSHQGIISYAELENRIYRLHSKLINESQVLSFYEFLFYIFLDWANALDVDYFILEVGLGGRLDATNLLSPSLCAITSVSRDHQKFLGHHLKDILWEKYQISRPHKLLVTALESRYLRKLVKQWASRDSVIHYDLFETLIVDSSHNFSERNTFLASQLAIELGIDRSFAKSYSWTPIIGRGQSITHGGLEINLYGSHNIDGMKKLMRMLCAKDFPEKTMILAFSMRELQDIRTMLLSVLAFTRKRCKIYVTYFDNWKALQKDQIKFILEELGSEQVEFLEDWKEFLSNSASHSHPKKILAAGSYYFIGQVYQYLYSH
ncbi:MAG: hypothetical protein H6621_01595 [Halobacteriovoraceae bacterium]|nr:hypothetical protein [Halobacteriovoraceae bacterium]